MYNIVAVGITQGLGNLSQYGVNSPFSESGGHGVIEITARHVFHGNEIVTVLLTHLINRHNGGVGQSANNTRLAQKSFCETGICRQFLGQNFQSNRTIEAELHSLVHSGHPALTDFIYQAIAC